jgi:putative copper export protein
MRKTLSSLIAAGIISAFAMPAFAQTTTPTGPSDCKSNETWDATTRTCKQKM